MKNKKYELTNNSISLGGKTLFRIKALKDFGNIKSGDLGGFIESEENLPHEGDCWVYSNAKVYGKSVLYGNAEIFEHSQVYDNAEIYGDAKVYGNAVIYGNAEVRGNAEVCGNAKVFDKS